MGGCLLWARQTIESEIFTDKPHSWFKIWFYLVEKVTHENKNRFERGSSFCKYEYIKDACKVTKDEIKHCIRWLKDNQMLATQKTTRGFIITVINYDKYQTMNNYYSHTEATQKPHRSHTILKNDKNNKKKEIYKEKDAVKRKDLYSEFVYISKLEHSKLVKLFGEKGTTERIKNLNDYIGSKGKKYKSHYHTILVWDKKNNPKKKDEEWKYHI